MSSEAQRASQSAAPRYTEPEPDWSALGQPLLLKTDVQPQTSAAQLFRGGFKLLEVARDPKVSSTPDV